MEKYIAVITGGESSERDISFRSARNITRILRQNFSVRVYTFPEDVSRFIQEKAECRLVVPVMHGKGGEDGSIQGFLETLNIPFLFSQKEAHVLALRKDVAKILARSCDIQVPEGSVVKQGECYRFPGYPVVIKPYDGGSSVATCIASSQKECDTAVEDALKVSEAVLVERRIVGREFTVGVVDGEDGPIALPVVEIITKSFFDYDQKYKMESLAKEVCPAELSLIQSQRLENIALKMHERFGCEHVSRTDMIMDEEENIWFLEINTIPGYTETSIIPRMLKVAGISDQIFFNALIEKTIKQYEEK